MSFKTHLKQILAVTLASISLVGCGGGGLFDNTPPYASFVKIEPSPTPNIVIYSSLDLANSIYTTPLRSCLPLNIKSGLQNSFFSISVKLESSNLGLQTGI